MGTVCIDVDGTLLLWPGRKPGRVPRKGEEGHGEQPTVNKSIVAYAKSRKAVGDIIIVWSMGGKDHAEMAARACGLADVVDLCCAKPAAIVDDSFRWVERVKKTHPKDMRA